MDNKIKSMLDEAIETELKGLSAMDSKDGKSDKIDDLTQLYKMRIEEIKLENDLEEKRARREMEEKQIENCKNEERAKSDQFKEEIKTRYIKMAIESAGIILPMIFYASWMRKGFKFEETGTFTSTTFKGLFNRFKPTK